MAKKNKGKLFIVATPIGNLKDITLRALETLKEVDIIACEDTRHTRVLLNHYNIKKPVISYFKHKEKQRTEQIIELLKKGKNIALVSDAGMPCISDPGAILVQAVHKENIAVTVLPGASAMISAIALCGIIGNFTFLGFLSEQKKQRELTIEQFKNIPTALIIYSSPYDLNKNLQFLYDYLGSREVFVVKEISKIYEKVYSGVLGQLEIKDPRGEYVIIVEEDANIPGNEITDQQIIKSLEYFLALEYTKKDAIERTCYKLQVNKNRVYELALRV